VAVAEKSCTEQRLDGDGRDLGILAHGGGADI
jgi:hypothetical protein